MQSYDKSAYDRLIKLTKTVIPKGSGERQEFNGVFFLFTLL